MKKPEKKNEFETCTSCGGIGSVPNHPHIIAHKCERCKGSGKVERSDYKQYNAGRADMEAYHNWDIKENYVPKEGDLVKVFKAWLKKKVSEEKIEEIIRIRYFKLMFPDITESDAEIVAGSLAKALTTYIMEER